MPYPTAPVELIRKELPFPTQIDNVVLAGVAEIPVPAGVTWCLLGVTAPCYMAAGGNAGTPTVNINDGTGSMPIGPEDPVELRRFNVKGISSLSFSGTAVVGIAWYGEKTDGIF